MKDYRLKNIQTTDDYLINEYPITENNELIDIGGFIANNLRNRHSNVNIQININSDEILSKLLKNKNNVEATWYIYCAIFFQSVLLVGLAIFLNLSSIYVYLFYLCFVAVYLFSAYLMNDIFLSTKSLKDKIVYFCTSYFLQAEILFLLIKFSKKHIT